MSDFKDLLNYCQAQAIANTLESNELSVWRSICRAYSKKFHTPLHLVLRMDPEEVMLGEFEEQLEDFDEEKDLESMLDKIYAIEDPEYENSKKAELDEFISKAEEEEEERIKLGKPIHRAMKEEVTLKDTSEDEEKSRKNRPTGGSISLKHLEAEENPYGEFKD